MRFKKTRKRYFRHIQIQIPIASKHPTTNSLLYYNESYKKFCRLYFIATSGVCLIRSGTVGFQKKLQSQVGLRGLAPQRRTIIGALQRWCPVYRKRRARNHTTARRHPSGTPRTWPGVSGSGAQPREFFDDFKAILKQNLHTTRPTAPRWKALIETCQKPTLYARG